MITVKLWGGMCNQMFQFAFGYALAKEKKDSLRFDVDFFYNQPKHVGKRSIIGVNEFPMLDRLEFTSRNNLIKFVENKYVNHIIRHTRGLDWKIGNNRIIVERLHRHYSDVPYSCGCENYYDGYWQTDYYFKEYENEIRRFFTPSDRILTQVTEWRKSIDSECCVAVHIRRGDYLDKINQGKITTTEDNDFYLSAFKLTKEKLDNPTFCFFSDDIEWCKESFSSILDNAVFVENKCKDGALLDLYSIAQCEHGIMSPSTFSYWGNWLRDPLIKSLVIYPEGDYSECFITNKNWIEIKKSN